ncbi:MAG TPA: hypothetical protein VF088_22555 [Pyrinomonadaceae bacterium]
MPNSTFFKNINESEAGEFISLASSVGGLASLAVQVVMGVISLFSQSDTDKILGAINQVALQLAVDFKLLGDLIKRQARIITLTVDRDAMAAALAHTNAGLFHLNTFLRTKSSDDLRFANNEAINGVGFFLNLNQTPPDIFFLPGLIKAGTVRVLVIVSGDPQFRTTRPDDVNEIRQMVALLGSLIEVIKQTVDAAHVVSSKSHIIRTNPPRFIIDGFLHDERVTDDVGNVSFQELQFFRTSGLPEDPDDPGAANALAAATNARNQGVLDELAFIGVPGFESVLQDWKTLIVDPNISLSGHGNA